MHHRSIPFSALNELRDLLSTYCPMWKSHFRDRSFYFNPQNYYLYGSMTKLREEWGLQNLEVLVASSYIDDPLSYWEAEHAVYTDFISRLTAWIHGVDGRMTVQA